MSESKSICFVLPSGMTLGGVSLWAMNLAERLARKGIQTALLRHAEIAGWGPVIGKDFPPEVRMFDCGRPDVLHARRRHVKRFSGIYKKPLPAAMVLNGEWASYAAAALCSEADAERMRVIGVCHADAQACYEELVYYEPVIHRFMAVSQPIAAELARRMPHRSDDVFVLPCGVDFPQVLARNYSQPGDPLRLLYAGRITNHQKRLSRIIPLALELDRRGVAFKMQIVGNGGYSWGLRQQVDGLRTDLRDRIVIQSMVSPDEMPALWQSADICMQVSDFEGASMSVMEAMGHGCVPVVNRVSGTEMLIRDAENGYLCPVGEDMGYMADRIARLAQSPDELQRMGTSAHSFMAEKYSYDQHMRRFLDLVDAVWLDIPRKWDTHKPVVMPNTPDMCRSPWTRIKSVIGMR